MENEREIKVEKVLDESWESPKLKHLLFLIAFVIPFVFFVYNHLFWVMHVVQKIINIGPISS